MNFTDRTEYGEMPERYGFRGRSGAWAYRESKDSKWKADAYLHCLTATKTVHSIRSRMRMTGHCNEFICDTSSSFCSKWYLPILFGAFTKLRKATISFVMSVRPSVRMELGSHWTDFHKIWYLSIFRKTVEKIKGSLKSDKSNGYFT